MISPLNKKEKFSFLDYCSEVKDDDFYITRDNKRKFLNNLEVADQVFNDVIKRGDLCYISEDKTINGILLIVGFSDKAPRKYLKIHADNLKVVNGLLRVLNWNYEGEVFLKIKKTNPVFKLLRKYRFRMIGNRGKEVLFSKQFTRIKEAK